VKDTDVIDLNLYRDRDVLAPQAKPERANFSVFGGDGDRSRFARPVWRSIYLVGCRRGALAWVPRGSTVDATAEFVLDLAADPARTDVHVSSVGDADSCDPPTLFETADCVAVFLGVREDRNWFLVLDDYGPAGAVAGYARGDLLFLAGECAGLLFFRELAEAGDKLDLE
jgi:hypothetical protein